MIIDIDLYKMDDETKKKVKNVKLDPNSRVHSSQSGGKHLFYLVDPSKLKPYYDKKGNLKHKLPVDLIENIDDKLNGYVVGPSCDGYKVENDILPANIDPKDLPKEWLKRNSSFSNNGKPEKMNDEKMKKRLEKAKEKDKEFRLLWKGEYAKAGFSDDRSKAEFHLANRIGFWFGRNEDIIRDLMNKANTKKWKEEENDSYRDSFFNKDPDDDKNPLKGDEYNPKKYSNNKKKDEEDEKEELKSASIVTDLLIAEEILNDNEVKYAIFNDGSLHYEHEIEINDEKIVPINDELVKEGVVKLAEKPVEYGNINELIEEIKAFIRKWLDISKDFEEMATWYILLTWVYDKFSTIPYLRFHGDWGTGKTRAVKTIGGLCYKALDTAGATTSAAIERMVNRWGGTMLMNEADFFNSDASADMVKILNEGFEKTGTIVKAHKERQDEVVIANPYSPKILATRKKWKDQALESRCLTETMQETSRDDILPILTDDFYQKQQELRNKLLMFRFKNYRKFDENKVKDIWSEIKNLNLERRLVQATINFSVLFYNDKEMFDRYTKFIQDRQRKMKEDRAATFDGGIVKAIYELKDDIQYITSSDIAEHMEEEQNYDEVYPQAIGKHLKNLGLSTKPKKVEGKTKRILEVENNKLKKIFKRYIVGYEKKVTGDTSVTGVTDTLDSFRGVKKEEESRTEGVSVTAVTHGTAVTERSLKQQIIDSLKEDDKPINKIIEDIEGYSKEEIEKELNRLKEEGLIRIEEGSRCKFYVLNTQGGRL